MNEKLEDEFKDILDKEELAILEKIKQKFEEKMSTQAHEYMPPEPVDMSNPYAFDDVNKPPNISDDHRELIFYIRGEISTIDHANKRYVSLDQCYNESYHIPIPSGISYEEALTEFTQEFEQHLSTLGHKVHKLKNE